MCPKFNLKILEHWTVGGTTRSKFELQSDQDSLRGGVRPQFGESISNYAAIIGPKTLEKVAYCWANKTIPDFRKIHKFPFALIFLLRMASHQQWLDRGNYTKKNYTLAYFYNVLLLVDGHFSKSSIELIHSAYSGKARRVHWLISRFEWEVFECLKLFNVWGLSLLYNKHNAIQNC